MKEPKHGLVGTHRNQEIEWACACPECTEHTEGHSTLTLIGHDHTYHSEDHLHGPDAVLMIGVTPCPEMDCHMAFPFGNALGNHIHAAHPHNSGKLGISQVAFVLIPVPPTIHHIVHEAYEIPGHGARRGKKIEEDHNIHSTRHTVVKAHLRDSQSIQTRNTHNTPLDQCQPSESALSASRNDGNDSGEQFFIGESLPNPLPPGWKAPVIHLDPMFNHGGSFATRKKLEHPGLTGSQQNDLQGYGRHMARAPKHNDPHSAYHSKKLECSGCNQVPEDSMLHHIENDEYHKDIFSCWHCGHFFNKQEDHLLRHLHKEHAESEKQRDEKRPCTHPGCKKTCSNRWHELLHMKITHHEKAAQLDPPSLSSGFVDQVKSHGHGEGKDHTKDHGKDHARVEHGKEKEQPKGHN